MDADRAGVKGLRIGEAVIVAGQAGPIFQSAGALRPIVLYGSYLLAMTALIVYGIAGHDRDEWADVFTDGGLVETLQALHVGAAAMLFGRAAVWAFRRRQEDRWFLVVFAIGTLLALHRESDYLWKPNPTLRVVYHSLKFAIALPLVVILVLKLGSFWEIWKRRPFCLPFSLLYVAIFGYAAVQCVAPVERLLGVEYVLRRVSEEAGELLVGSFFLFAAVEVLWRQRQRPAVPVRL